AGGSTPEQAAEGRRMPEITTPSTDLRDGTGRTSSLPATFGIFPFSEVEVITSAKPLEAGRSPASQSLKVAGLLLLAWRPGQAVWPRGLTVRAALGDRRAWRNGSTLRLSLRLPLASSEVAGQALSAGLARIRGIWPCSKASPSRRGQNFNSARNSSMPGTTRTLMPFL